MPFHPYLFFGGNCREAFTRYQEVFGGELVLITAEQMGEVPPGASPDAIMHAALKLGEELLMGSDDPTDEFRPAAGMKVNFSTTDVEVARKAFEAIAEGGTVDLPIGPTAWSPAFGMCVDRFGTPWMISADPEETFTPG